MTSGEKKIIEALVKKIKQLEEAQDEIIEILTAFINEVRGDKNGKK